MEVERDHSQARDIHTVQVLKQHVYVRIGYTSLHTLKYTAGWGITQVGHSWLRSWLKCWEMLLSQQPLLSVDLDTKLVNHKSNWNPAGEIEPKHLASLWTCLYLNRRSWTFVLSHTFANAFFFLNKEKEKSYQTARVLALWAMRRISAINSALLTVVGSTPVVHDSTNNVPKTSLESRLPAIII